MATGSVRTEADRVVGATRLRFVFRMAGETPQLGAPMSELAFVAVFAYAELFVWPTQFGFVSGGVHRVGGNGGALGGGWG